MTKYINRKFIDYIDNFFLIFFFEKFLVFVGVVDNHHSLPPHALRLG